MSHAVRTRGGNLGKPFALGLALLGSSLTFGAGTAQAEQLLSYRWSADPTMRVATISFPAGSIWRDGLQTGVSRWNNVGGTWLDFNLSFQNYSSYRTGDGVNNVAFVRAEDVDNNWAWDAVRRSGSRRVESDIVFNADISWRPEIQDERVRFTDAPSFIQAGVIHEFGHSAGLGHETGELAQMAQGYSGAIWYGGCGAFRHHPTPDDSQGFRRQHGNSGQTRDAALLNFEMRGSNSTQLWRNNSTVTTVSPGQRIDVEYTVANAGSSSASFDLGIYLSKNDYISKWDRYIGGFSYGMPASSEWERDKSFTLPSDLEPGEYFIGAVVDTEDDLGESRECNNRLVFPGKWIVQ